MSKGWMTLLILFPVLAISIATVLIVKSVNKPVQTTDDIPVSAAPTPTTMPIAESIAALSTSRPVQTPATRAVVVTPSPAPKVIAKPDLHGTLSGAAWITRNSGESLIQRGLVIRIIKSSMPADQLLVLAKVALPTLESTIKDDEQELTKWQNRVIADDDQVKGGFDKDGFVARELESSKTALVIEQRLLADGRSKSDTLKGFIDQNPATVATDNGYKIHQALGDDLTFDPQGAKLQIDQCKTDVDGKFSIELPGGDYFLYVRIDTEALFIEWLLPVHIASAPVKIDLDNDNAAAIRNSH